MKGFNYADWNSLGRDQPWPLYNPPFVDSTLKNLAATGTNWVILLVHVAQDTITSTNVTRNTNRTASDSSLRYVIELAHSLGVRVALNPNIQLLESTQDHVQIGTGFTSEAQWQAWFASYREMIIHYATLAQDAGTDMFFIGQELAGTVQREADWRDIAQAVRQVYKGPIAYEATVTQVITNQPVSEDLRVNWWDAVDYIGVLGYFRLTESTNPTVEDLKSAWVQQGYLPRLGNLSKRFQRPIIISEIGYLAQDGTNMFPSMGSFRMRFPDAPLDLQEQADCYRAALEVLGEQSWLKGIFWWQWLANPVKWPGGPNDKSEFPYGKPAEEVLKKFYLSQDK